MILELNPVFQQAQQMEHLRRAAQAERRRGFEVSALLKLILSVLGGPASENELVKISFRAAAIVPGLPDGDPHLSPEELGALSDLILDVRAGRL